MKNRLVLTLLLIAQLANVQMASAYLRPVDGYVGDGSLFLETDSIVRKGSSVSLVYVENFDQPQAYGSRTYSSKATTIRLDCLNRRIFAVAESFYSDASLQGTLLGRYPLQDEFGSTPEEGSWNYNLLNLGCAPK